jgi:glycosyltransferase involved in cell wall biosynthesis
MKGWANDRPLKILFVAMTQSIHTAGWIGQLAGTGWDIHVFNAMDAGLIPELTGVTAYTFSKPSKSSCNVKHVEHVSSVPLVPVFLQRRFPGVAHFFWPSRIDSLTDLIHHLKPDIVHSLEMQLESYPLLEVRKRLGGEFSMPWIYSSWGIDLYWFGKQPAHEMLIRQVLGACDYYIADCQRDVALATEYGFKGEVLGVFPGAGGLDIHRMRESMQPGPISTRRTIALKGYQDMRHRAISVLKAMKLCADALKGYTVVVYGAQDGVPKVARQVSEATGIKIEVFKHVPLATLTGLLGRSRIAIGAALADGTPVSMLEAMVMGALPIQSDTISTAEWINHGENGLLVPPEEPEAIADSIRRAVSDDDLVNRAAELNFEVAQKRLDQEVIRPQVIQLYEKVAAQGRPKG